MLRYIVVLISFIVFMSPFTYASRLALVIGNGDYHHEPSLANPVNDATDIAAVLKNLGFEVILKRNAKRRAMIRAVQDFGEQLPRHDVGLFYYSGHGLQARGENFLVPVDAQIKSKADIEFESVSANRILHQMDEANNGVNIVILDACRDNPFTTSQKGFRKGLAEMNSPTGSLIAFATVPNTSAWGGQSGKRNSIYTKHFLRALQNQAHLSITDLFTQVRKEVIQETKNETIQVPWESVSLLDRFCFGSCGSGEPGNPVQASRLALVIDRFCFRCSGEPGNPVQASRLALVIGNNDYIYESLLNSPVNDARDMATVLRGLGFTVIDRYNLKQRDFEQVVQSFEKQLQKYNVGLFYYSGHGLQAQGNNYLVPIDARIESAVDIKYTSINANWILEKMEYANKHTNLLILDACRDNPFKSIRKGFNKGLAEMSPKGSLIAFATAPGTTALDGLPTERNSIYTKHLLNQLRTQPHLSVSDLLTQVAGGVARETNQKQWPWKSDSLTSMFYFASAITSQ